MHTYNIRRHTDQVVTDPSGAMPAGGELAFGMSILAHSIGSRYSDDDGI